MAKNKRGTVSVMRNVLVTKKIKKPKKSEASKIVPWGIGTFAGVQFHVIANSNGSLDIITMSDVTQEVTANWAEHQIIGAKYPKHEFLGSGTRRFTMTVVVDVNLGQNPHKVMKKLNSFCEKGKVDELYMGKHKIGQKWKLESMSQAWDRIYTGGRLTKVTLQLTLSQYT